MFKKDSEAPDNQPPAQKFRIKLKYKLTGFLGVLILIGFFVFFVFPRAGSLLLSYKKQCKVLRVEPFMKGFVVTGPGQSNKFSIICDDGSVCRSGDTGFAAVKTGDTIVFRGFPEFATFEEFGKCDNAQLLRIHPPQN